jgi:hypothetical protein
MMDEHFTDWMNISSLLLYMDEKRGPISILMRDGWLCLVTSTLLGLVS